MGRLILSLRLKLEEEKKILRHIRFGVLHDTRRRSTKTSNSNSMAIPSSLTEEFSFNVKSFCFFSVERIYIIFT